MANSRNVDATRGSLLGKSIHIAWPAVLQALLVNFYAFNDFFFVGLLGDRAATAALSACFALLVINYTLLRVIPTGATTLISRAFGRGESGRVADVLRQALTSEGVWSLVVGAVGLAILPWLVTISNVTPAVGARIDAYLTVVYLASPFFATMLVVIGAFRACGNTRIPLMLEIGSLVLNALLNWVLVLGVGPVPSMGITGAAIATAASRGLPGVVGLWLIWRGHLDIDLTAAADGWWPRWDDIRQMFRIGIFQSVSGFVYGSVFFILNRMAGELGPAAQGGLGAGVRGIEWIAYAFGDGFSTASIAVVGQNIGAGKLDRAVKGAWLNAGLSALCCQTVGLAFLIAPRALSTIVTDDPATLAYAAEYVGTIGWVMWAIGLEMALHGAMVGAGRTHVTMLVAGGLNLVRLPAAAALLFGLDGTLQGIEWAVVGTASAPAVAGGFYAIAWAIAGTGILKASLMSAYMATGRMVDRQAAQPDAHSTAPQAE